MTEKHVVARDVPDNIRSVLAWWSEETASKWNLKWTQFHIAYFYDGQWFTITDIGWVRCVQPDFWWELPEVDA